MNWRVILLDGARREMRQAAASYEHEREGLGDRFLDEIAAVRSRVATHPESFPPWSADLEFRQAVVNVFPFVVFFRIDEVRGVAVIVAIAHTRREPGYWKARLEP